MPRQRSPQEAASLSSQHGLIFVRRSGVNAALLCCRICVSAPSLSTCQNGGMYYISVMTEITVTTIQKGIK